MLYQITKNGRVGQFEPKPPSALGNTLEKYMSYKRQGAQFMPNPNWAWVRLYKIKTARFPWGMLETVRNVIEKWSKLHPDDSFTIKHGISKTPVIENLNPKLRYYQADAIVQLTLNGGGILCLPTGAGKTFAAIEYLRIMDKKSLVIVHTIDLRKQWEAQVPDSVDVVTYQSIKDKTMLKKYEILVFDECHHVVAKTIYDIAIKGGNSLLVGLCVHPKTLITVEGNKKKQINSLKVGDKVLSYNSKEKKFENKKIVNKFETVIKDHYYKISVQIEGYKKLKTVRCSKEHKFKTDRGWVKAKDLKEFDEIYTIDKLTYDVWNKGKKGQKSFMKGKTFEEVCGSDKGKKIKKHLSDINKGKKRTEESIEKFKETVKKNGSFVGNRNSMYTNGISSMNRKLKREVKNCEECGVDLSSVKFRDIHVHHIDKDRSNNDRSNLKVVCVKCHMKTHEELGDRRGRYSK